MGFWLRDGEDPGLDQCAAEFGAEAAGENPAPVTVVGCGNWRDRDDRVGPRALAALRGRLAPDVALADVGVTVLGLLDLLHGQELLVLVDACVGRARPGAVTILDADAADPPVGRPSLHQIGPLETLAVTRELYPDRLPRTIRLVLIETGGLAEEEEAAAVRHAVAAVEGEIDAWRRARAARGDHGTCVDGETPWNAPRN